MEASDQFAPYIVTTNTMTTSRTTRRTDLILDSTNNRNISKTLEAIHWNPNITFNGTDIMT